MPGGCSPAGRQELADPRCTPQLLGVPEGYRPTLAAILDVNRSTDGPPIRPARIRAAEEAAPRFFSLRAETACEVRPVPPAEAATTGFAFYMPGAPDGSRLVDAAIEGPPEQAVALGETLAAELRSRGADEILAALEHDGGR